MALTTSTACCSGSPKAGLRRIGPPAGIDSLPALTVEALAKVTAFWTRFQDEPDSIRSAKTRQAHSKEVMVPVGKEWFSVVMTDMITMAATYPSVATALKAAGLTGAQAEAYWMALISVKATKAVENLVGTPPPSSILGKNVTFVDEHAANIEALATTGIWFSH